MFERHPHIGKMVIGTETDNGTGIPKVNDTEIEVKGRYEPTGQNKKLDYKAKFYCGPLNVAPFEVDGHRFLYNGRQFKIVQLHHYQRHCELWLE